LVIIIDPPSSDLGLSINLNTSIGKLGLSIYVYPEISWLCFHSLQVGIGRQGFDTIIDQWHADGEVVPFFDKRVPHAIFSP